MDKASEKIQHFLDKYTNLLQEVEAMKLALSKVDLDSFHEAHERMMNYLETIEILIESDDKTMEVDDEELHY